MLDIGSMAESADLCPWFLSHSPSRVRLLSQHFLSENKILLNFVCVYVHECYAVILQDDDPKWSLFISTVTLYLNALLHIESRNRLSVYKQPALKHDFQVMHKHRTLRKGVILMIVVSQWAALPTFVMTLIMLLSSA